MKGAHCSPLLSENVCGSDIKPASPQCVTQFHAEPSFVPPEENAQLLPLKWAIFLAKYSFQKKALFWNKILTKVRSPGTVSFGTPAVSERAFLSSVQPIIGANERYFFFCMFKKDLRECLVIPPQP